jgi:TRAP-type mannitol/chloroaromatic compound transport system substrate-binding protein
MDRRRLLTAGSLALAGLGAACTPTGGSGDAVGSAPMVNRQQHVKLSLVTTWPKDLPGLGDMPKQLGDLARAMSGGTLDITVYAAGEIVPAFESFDAVANGTVDLYHGAEYYWQGKAKGFNFFCSVPLGLTANEMNAWIYAGGGQALWDGLSADFGIKPIMCGTTGHQMGGWFKRPVETLDDFRGLTMRIPGLGGEVVRALGGAAIALSGGEIFAALESGAVDATEWVGPWNDLALGFFRQAPYYYGPGFHEPGAALAIGVNRGIWEKLSSEHRAILEAASAAITARSIGHFTFENARALDTLITEHGVELRSFSDEMWQAISTAADDVVASVAAGDAQTSAIHDSYRQARSLGARWHSVSDAPYFKHRSAHLQRG